MVSFSAPLYGRPYPQEISLVLIYVRAEFEPRTIMLSLGHKFWSLRLSGFNVNSNLSTVFCCKTPQYLTASTFRVSELFCANRPAGADTRIVASFRCQHDASCLSVIKYNARSRRECRTVMWTHVTHYLVQKKQSKLNIMYRKPVLKLKPAALLVVFHKQIATVNGFMESSQLMS